MGELRRADLLSRTWPTDGRLWEPLWQLETDVSPLEADLLATAALRRLHFVHHGGASMIASNQTYSRLQHTLGVFALCAHLAPDDAALRAAALLHDVGHPPFSHTLERVLGLRHHERTAHLITSTPLADLLDAHGVDPLHVVDIVTGPIETLLRNRSGAVQLDHLDSWVRNGQGRGVLPLRPVELLRGVRRRGERVDFDLAAAGVVFDLIIEEARYHCSATDLGPAVVLAELVGRLLRSGDVDAQTLIAATDSELEALLRNHHDVSEEAERLWWRPFELSVARPDAAPSDSYRVVIDRLYLAQPRVDGRPLADVATAVADRIEDVQRSTGEYAVWWSSP